MKRLLIALSALTEIIYIQSIESMHFKCLTLLIMLYSTRFQEEKEFFFH